MAKAESTGLSVIATFNVAMGPKAQVMGARMMPIRTVPVLASRFTPWG